MVTGSAVHARCASASQRSRSVSSRRPSLETSTTLPRSSTSLVSWFRSPSSPVTVHERALVALLDGWSTLIVTFFIDVVFCSSKVSEYSASSCQRDPSRPVS